MLPSLRWISKFEVGIFKFEPRFLILSFQPLGWSFSAEVLESYPSQFYVIYGVMVNDTMYKRNNEINE